MHWLPRLSLHRYRRTGKIGIDRANEIFFKDSRPSQCRPRDHCKCNETMRGLRMRFKRHGGRSDYPVDERLFVIELCAYTTYGALDGRQRVRRPTLLSERVGLP